MYRHLYCISLACINVKIPTALSTSVCPIEHRLPGVIECFWCIAYWNVNSWRASRAYNQCLVWSTHSINSCWKQLLGMLWLLFFHCLSRCSFPRVAQPCLLAMLPSPTQESSRLSSLPLWMQGLLDLGPRRLLQAKLADNPLQNPCTLLLKGLFFRPLLTIWLPQPNPLPNCSQMSGPF